MTPIFSTARRVAAFSVLCGLYALSPLASAASLNYAVASDNWTFTGTDQVDVAGMTTPTFTKTANKRLIVVFTAECAVDAPAGNANAWLDVDIVVRNATTGAIVLTAAPTVGNMDAFCSSTGTAGFGHWEMHAVQALIPYTLAAGTYKASVKARLNNGATGGWLGERMLTVSE